MKSIFGVEFQVLTTQSLARVENAIASQSIEFLQNCSPIQVQLGCVCVDDSAKIEIGCLLPLDYPEMNVPTVCALRCAARFSKRAEQQFTAQAQQHLDSLIDQESLYELVEFVKSHASEFIDILPSVVAESAEGDSALQPSELRFVAIHFHHIYNDTKKRTIVSLARDLDLTGIYKFGKPGRVCVEGTPQGVAQFLTQIRGLHWQQMQVRSDETRSCSDKKERSFVDFSEIQTEGELSIALKNAGLEQVFLELTGLSVVS